MNNTYVLKRSGNGNRQAVLGLVTSAFGIGLILFALGVGESAEPNSADEMLVLTTVKKCANFTDADLDLWKSRGVDGFLCNVGWLRPFGGTQNYTGDPNANLTGSDYVIQRTFRDNKTISRAKAKGISMYLDFYLVNYWNGTTPLNEWFNDSKWESEAIPFIQDLAAAAKLLGFVGISYDSEPYSGNFGVPTWDWNYPGNTHTESQVRAKVKERGRQVMQAILSGFPNVQIIAYSSYLPETGDEIIQTLANNSSNTFEDNTHINFIDGLTSVNGYSAFHLSTETFYKECYYSWLPCDNVLQEHTNKLYSLLSRRLSNWDYASERFFSPLFIWINGKGSNTGWARPRSVEHVSRQLNSYKKWGNGRKLLIYDFGGLVFDYTPYVASMQQTSRPEVVDSVAPTLVITSPDTSGAFLTASSRLSLTGYAKDNLAIQAVRWSNDRGGRGAAQMDWEVFSSYSLASWINYYQTSWDWQTNWNIADIPLQPGLNKITLVVEDIKGLTTAQVLNVTREYTAQVLNVTREYTANPTPQPAPTSLSDTTAPSVPSNLSATPVSKYQINLSWTASIDNAPIAYYRIERCQGSACTNFTGIGRCYTTSYQNTALSTSQTYRYRLRAVDAAGNLSAYSGIVSATTLAR